jgi:hemerythrin
MFGLEHAINCFIPSRGYMPRGYGQLGCSGFVVADGKGNFVSRKTVAFLQYGDEAFRRVESMLESLVGPSFGSSTMTPSTRPGTMMEGPTSKQHCSVPSIGIDSMDEEHERCDKALEVLLKRPTVSNLRTVLNELRHHFDHEEGLLVLHGFGGDPKDPFSALHSHIKDHKNILDLVESAIATTSQKVASTISSCNEDALGS